MSFASPLTHAVRTPYQRAPSWSITTISPEISVDLTDHSVAPSMHPGERTEKPRNPGEQGRKEGPIAQSLNSDEQREYSSKGSRGAKGAKEQRSPGSPVLEL